jgi:hypothetical protein
MVNDSVYDVLVQGWGAKAPRFGDFLRQSLFLAFEFMKTLFGNKDVMCETFALELPLEDFVPRRNPFK